jgi:hypothetical protein
MKVWVYKSRRGEIQLFAEDKRHWARIEQDADNGCSVEDILANPELYGDGEIDGDPNEGNFSIDDGGSIKLVLVQE